jgi:hypothetical protein
MSNSEGCVGDASSPLPSLLPMASMQAHAAPKQAKMAAIQALDERISVLERELLAVKRQRNALVTAVSLPSEVLAGILHHTQHPDGLENTKIPALGYDRNWTRVMLVCSVWREVAVQAPVLWTIVDCSCAAPWVELCVQRSRAMTLHLDGYYSVDMARPLARAKSLNISYNSAHGQDIGVGLRAPAPQMEVVDIFSPGRYRLAVDERFLGGTTAALVQLTLTSGTIDFGPMIPPMPVLRVLELIGVTTTVEAVAPLGQRAPALEMLLLEDLLLPELGPEPPSRAQIARPRLRTLIVAGEPSHVSALLEVLPAPSAVFGVMAVARSTSPRLASAQVQVIYGACEAFLAALGPGKHTGTIKDKSGLAEIMFGLARPADQRRGRVRDWTGCTFSCYINNLAFPAAPHPFLARIATMHLAPSWDEAWAGTDVARGVHFLPGLRALVLMKGRGGEAHPERVEEIKLRLETEGKIEQVQFVDWDPWALRPFSDELDPWSMPAPIMH